MKCTQTEENSQFQAIIHYQNTTMNYPLNKDTESWDDAIYESLLVRIKSHFKLNGEITIKYEDNELDNYEDLLDEYEALMDDKDCHALHLHVTCTNNDQPRYRFSSHSNTNPSMPRSPQLTKSATIEIEEMELAHVEAVSTNNHEEIEWQEYVRMFENIGWNGQIPDKYEDVESTDRDLFETISTMMDHNITPSTIKDKKTFCHKLGDDYKKNQQYIDSNLNAIQPSNPTLPSDDDMTDEEYVEM